MLKNSLYLWNIYYIVCDVSNVSFWKCDISSKVYLNRDVEPRDQFKSYNLLANKHIHQSCYFIQLTVEILGLPFWLCLKNYLHSIDSWDSWFTILASLEELSFIIYIFWYILNILESLCLSNQGAYSGYRCHCMRFSDFSVAWAYSDYCYHCWFASLSRIVSKITILTVLKNSIGTAFVFSSLPLTWCL